MNKEKYLNLLFNLQIKRACNLLSQEEESKYADAFENIWKTLSEKEKQEIEEELSYVPEAPEDLELEDCEPIIGSSLPIRKSFKKHEK